MTKIVALLRRDYRHVRGNVIAMLVCMGLAIMPSLYAWFNIAGGWDPYGNTGSIQVALANSDEGVHGGLIPYRINVGERVVNQLSGSTKIGYVVTSEEDAIEGVESGAYYAAVVIPADFSTKLMSVLTNDPTHPQLDYYVNQKRNAIASIVTGKASGSVQTMVDEGFAEAVSQVSVELMDELDDVLDDDSMLSVASAFDTIVDDSLHALRRTADDLEAYRGVVASIRSVTDAAAGVVGKSSPSLDAADTLSEAAGGVREFGTAADTARQGADDAIDAGKDALDDVEGAINDALTVADGEVDRIVEAFGKVDEVARARRDDLKGLYDALDKLNGQADLLSAQLDRTVGVADVDVQASHTVTNDISDLMGRLGNAIAYLDEIIATSERGVSDVQQSKANVVTRREELGRLAQQAREEFDGVRNSYEDRLSTSLESLASSIDDAAADAGNVSAKLRDRVGKLEPLMDDASDGLERLERTLGAAKKKVNKAADRLQGLHDRLHKALASGDLELVRRVFGADASALVSFFTAPVELDRETVYAVENNGSAMAPYYTTMALWVGGTLMGVLLYASVSQAALDETGAKPRHAYFARLLFFLTVGLLQSSILLLGDLFFLRIQCESPWLFLLAGWLASTVFINVIFALSASFGDVGKAIGVLLMVVQVAGSGGTFPVQMLPPVFQSLYRFLPFVYSETAMREAICGVYGDHWLVAMGTLASYLVPALLLGLVLRKPFVPLNEWVEEHLERTKLM